MSEFKSPLGILAECADMDTSVDTNITLEESLILEGYRNIPEVDYYVPFTADMVPVQKIGNDYMVEAYSIMPFMKDSGITSMGKALDCVAEANGLPEKSVGLLIESMTSVEDTINAAIGTTDEAFGPMRTAREIGNRAKDTTKKVIYKAKNSTFKGIGKTRNLAEALENKGYIVKKKVSN